MDLNEDELREVLKESFDPEPDVLDAVVEQAVKLDKSGEWKEVSDIPLTEEFIDEKLQMADRELKGSWNWWIGQLDYVNEGGFRRFQVR